MADVFVFVDDDVALAGFDGEGNDFIVELTSVLGGFRFVLGCQSEFVLHGAADLPLLGDVFGCLTHVVAVERIPQTVADHRVDVFHVAHLVTGAQVRGVCGQRHVFLTAGTDDVRITQLDVLCTQRNSAKTRTTNLVDAPSRRFFRKARVDVCLTGRVLALCRGQNLTQNGFRHIRFVDASTCDQRLENGSAQIMRRGVGKRAVEATYSGTRCGCDDDVGHIWFSIQ